MTILRILVGIQIAVFFLLPPIALSAAIGDIAGMFTIIIWGFVCAFLYGYTQSKGLVKFKETALGKIYIEDAQDSFHLGLLKFNLAITAIFLISISLRGWSWLESPIF